MTCSRCKSCYTAYKDGELPGVLRGEVEKHISTCAACRSVYTDIDRILDTSSSLPRFAASENLARSVLSRIRSRESVQVTPVRPLSGLIPRLAYGALVMVITGVVTFLLLYGPARRTSLPAAALTRKERIYSLGREVGSSDVFVKEPDYSLGQMAGSRRTIYSLPAHSANAKLASY
ncbi:MAG: anti-sigma factor family protein [bacterium]